MRTIREAEASLVLSAGGGVAAEGHEPSLEEMSLEELLAGGRHIRNLPSRRTGRGIF